MKLKLARYISLILLVAWMCVIFCFSAENAEKSDSTSDEVIVKVVEHVYPKYKTLPEKEQKEVVEKFSFPVRKLAHFSEFFLLGILSAVFFATFISIKVNLRVVLALLLGLLYATSDEIHQLFIDGRACRFTDVLIDFSGVALAVLLIYIIVLRSGRIERKRHKA